MTHLKVNQTKVISEVIAEINNPPQAVDTLHRISSIEQLRELWMIDGEAYEDCLLPFDVFETWWRRYEPGMTQVRRDGELIASIGIFPISPEQYTQFTTGVIAEAELLPVTLEECEVSPQQYWYFSGVVLIPELRGKKKAPLKLLLSVALEQWRTSGHIQYPVHNCAMAYSEEGEQMVKRFSFLQIPNSESFPDYCPLYQMTLDSEQELLNLIRRRGCKVELKQLSANIFYQYKR
jgi:hypothetical protein